MSGVGQRLNKGLSRARGIEATKPPEMNAEHHGPALARQVTKRTLAKAVHPGGNLRTVRARCRSLMRVGENGDLFGVRQNVVDYKISRDHRQ